MKYQKYVDSQKKECNGRYLNKGSGPLFTLKQSIHTLAYPLPFYSSVLREYRIWWPVLQKRKYSAYEGPALYHGL